MSDIDEIHKLIEEMKLTEIKLPDTNLLVNSIKDTSINNLLIPINESHRQMEEATKFIARKREERELREIRSLEINEEILELNKFTNFLLQSVNKNQKEMLEGIQSLIDTISIDDKIKEANLSLIQEELINLRESTDNLNQGFIDLIKVKMTEMGVETAIKYLFIGLKTLFLNN